MRILWLSDFYPPFIGGLERHVRMVACQLAERGHQVSVATVWHAQTSDFELDGSVRVYRLKGTAQKFQRLYSDPRRRFHPTAPDPAITNGLRRIIAAEKPQIVIVSGWILYSYLPLKDWSKAKLLVRHHDYAFTCPKRTYFRNGKVCDGPGKLKCFSCAADHYNSLRGLVITASFSLFSHWHGRVDRHLPVSHFVSKTLIDTNRIDPATVQVIPAPVPDEIFDGAPDRQPPSGPAFDDEYMLFVGGLTEPKGLPVLLKAYQDLGERTKLVLIGTEWPDTPSAYPDGVVVMKNAPHHFVIEAFSRCLFSIVPSTFPEPFGQVAVEAMAASKPVIASAVGGLTDIVIDWETGILVEPGNAVMLRQTMKQLLKDDSLRKVLGQNGYWRAKREFTCTRVTDQVEEVCKAVLEGDLPVKQRHSK